MTPKPYQILCFGIIYLIDILISIYQFFKIKFKRLIHLYKLYKIDFKKYTEESYIQSQNLKYPSNIALILNSFEFLKISPIKFIKYCIYTKQIKYITLYDPFNRLDIAFIKDNLGIIFEDKNIIISYKDKEQEQNIIFHCQKNIKIKKNDLNYKKYDLLISIIGFNSANIDLIKKIFKNKKDEYIYPEETIILNNETQNKNYLHEYEKYYTRKIENNLPELIITFGNCSNYFNENICLYGFPFTLLENCEIYNIKDINFDDFDIITFLEIFTKNALIQKRFGS